MSRLVHFFIRERTVVAIILVNTMALFAAGFYPEGSSRARFWTLIDWGCIVYFTVEAILKIRLLSFATYWRSGWNRVDFVVLLCSLPALAAPMVDVRHFSVVLLLRLGRLLRLFRLLRFIPDREHLVEGITRSLKASVGVFLAVMLLLFILSMGANQLFAQIAPEHFGDPLISLYSIFKVFTVEGWHELPDLLAQRADHAVWATVARIYFSATVLLVGILGFSLVNAVFVDEMIMDNNNALEAKVDTLSEEIRALRVELAEARGTTPPADPDP